MCQYERYRHFVYALDLKTLNEEAAALEMFPFQLQCAILQSRTTFPTSHRGSTLRVGRCVGKGVAYAKIGEVQRRHARDKQLNKNVFDVWTQRNHKQMEQKSSNGTWLSLNRKVPTAGCTQCDTNKKEKRQRMTSEIKEHVLGRSANLSKLVALVHHQTYSSKKK